MGLNEWVRLWKLYPLPLSLQGSDSSLLHSLSFTIWALL